MKPAALETWIDRLRAWAERRSDIAGVAIVGSHARGAASEDSDLDVVLVADDASIYLDRRGWLEDFGKVAGVAREDYGLVQSLRVNYASGEEVEWGVTDLRWCAVPPDAATAKVVSAGMRVVYDRDGGVTVLHNRPLAAAIAALAAAELDDVEARFRSVLDELVKSTLLTGEDSFIEGEDGEELLALFTDTVELFAFDSGTRLRIMRGEDAIRRVAAGDYDGLIIDPRGRSFELAAEDVEELFEIDEP